MFRKKKVKHVEGIKEVLLQDWREVVVMDMKGSDYEGNRKGVNQPEAEETLSDMLSKRGRCRRQGGDSIPSHCFWPGVQGPVTEGSQSLSGWSGGT